MGKEWKESESLSNQGQGGQNQMTYGYNFVNQMFRPFSHCIVMCFILPLSTAHYNGDRSELAH